MKPVMLAAIMACSFSPAVATAQLDVGSPNRAGDYDAIGWESPHTPRPAASSRPATPFAVACAAATLSLVGLALLVAGGIWARWPDEADEEDESERIQHINELLNQSR